MSSVVAQRWSVLEDRLERARPGYRQRDTPGRWRRLTRNVAVDLLMFGLSLAVGLAGHHSLLNGLVGHPLWLRVLDIAVGVVGFGMLWFRRRIPMVFALWVVVFSPISTLLSGLTFVAAFTTAVHRRWPSAVLVAVLLVAGTWPSLWLYRDPRESALSTFIAATLATFAFTGWGMFIRARRELVASLRDRAERAEAERQAQIEAARRSERERIAREMHDVLAHRLSLLSVHAGALEFRTDASPDEVARAAGVIRANAHDGLVELRSVVRMLREAPGEDTAPPQPTLTDLPDLVDESRRAGADVHLDVRVAQPDAVSPRVGRTVYRVVQEGLTNARKHAPGAVTRIVLSGDRDAGVTVEMSTPRSVRPRVDPVPGSGTGLVGLAERASLAGGRLQHGHTDDGGFRLTAWLPWEQE